MTITIGNPLAAVGTALGILLALLTIFRFAGSAIWRTVKDDHRFRSELSAILLNIQKDITRHDSRLDAGDKTMSRMEGILQANSAQLSQIQMHVARIDGQCAARAQVEAR